MRDINKLHPEVKLKAEKLIKLAKERLGLRIIITDTLRTDAEQMALFAQGRRILVEVNRLRKLAGMSEISASQNKRVVTNAKTASFSFHGFGLAFDIAITDSTGKVINWNKADWNANKLDDWREVGELAEECGLEWGGNFTSIYDAPHYQDRRGMTLAKLQASCKSGEVAKVK